MSALGTKLRWSRHEGRDSLHWWCPGCKGGHGIRVRAPDGSTPGPSWIVSGTPEAPVFSPSVLVYVDLAGGRQTECHCFVGGSSGQCPGMIEFCGDSPHALAGQTVPLPAWPASYGGP